MRYINLHLTSTFDIDIDISAAPTKKFAVIIYRELGRSSQKYLIFYSVGVAFKTRYGKQQRQQRIMAAINNVAVNY